MTTKEYIAQIDTKMKQILQDNKPAFLGINTALALMTRRIFVDGKNMAGNKIGSYSKKPIYINPDDSPKDFTPMGKHGDTGQVRGKKRKTKYFARGYHGFRSHINRESNFVNLRLTNDLQSDFTNSATPSEPPSVEKATTTEWVIRVSSENMNKILGNEKRFKAAIFDMTESELKKMVETIELETAKILNS